MAATFRDVFPQPDILMELPAEEVALFILEFLRGAPIDNTGMLSGHNFTHPDGYVRDYAGPRAQDVAKALTEGWVWLEREGMIAPQPGNANRDFVYITQKGQRLKTTADLSAYQHQQLLRDQALDPELAKEVLPLFRPNDYDTPVFKAFKIGEVRVRAAAGLPPDLVGVPLMRRAFGIPGGPLTDTSLPAAEQEAMQHLFAGAIGLFKNPSSHRYHVKTAEEAAMRILNANLLLQILGPANAGDENAG